MDTSDKRRERWILIAAILASGMAFLDGSTTSIALPTIQAQFHAGIQSLQWIVNGFALALASLLLLSGSLGDRFGRKKIFSWGIGLFIFASLLSGLAKSTGQLIAFQTLQGIGAAMMIPGSLAIINIAIPSERRGKAIGLWAGFAGGVAALGPFAGGWIVQHWGWPWTYFINIPLGLFALLITLKFVPESKNDAAETLDISGTILVVLGLLGLAFGLIQGPQNGWSSPLVMAGLAIGVVCLVAFGWVEKKAKHPLVPLHLFKSPLVLGANLATLLVYFGLNGMIFFVVLNLQQLQQLSPTLAGLALLPPTLLITFLSGPAGSLADKIGPRTQMVVAPLINAAAMALLLIPGPHASYFRYFFPPLVLFGIGMCLIIAPLTKSALAVEPNYSGAASGVNNAVARVAALLAIAILGAVVVSTFNSSLRKNISGSAMDARSQNEILQQSNRMAAIEVPKDMSTDEQNKTKEIIKDSFVKGFRVAMGINLALALIAAGTSYIFIKNPEKVA